MTEVIDLRSDTVTLPSAEMRRVIYEAEVGDDVFGEDPTVNRLQERIAAEVGCERALFVPSGTMGNLVAALTHLKRGDEAIMGDQSHMFYYEGGGSAVLGGASLRTVANAVDGTLPLAALAHAVRTTSDVHQPRTGLICLENTHNRCGGVVLSPAYMSEVRHLADRAHVPIHLDGARLFNAAVALDLPLRDLTQAVDSVNVCFSKGLAAPVGSALCGSQAFIEEARRWRKMVGGGMRQAGLLAAAALYALDHMMTRLADDHAHARLLAEGLTSLPGLRLAQPAVETDIVLIDVADSGLDAATFLAALRSVGVLGVAFTTTVVRFVTHYGIERPAIDTAVERIRSVLAERTLSVRP